MSHEIFMNQMNSKYFEIPEDIWNGNKKIQKEKNLIILMKK